MPDLATTKPVLRCAWVDRPAAQAAVHRWHYSRSLPAGKLVCIGAWEDERFLGVVIFSRGANRHIGSPYGLEQTEVCELTRVALDQHRTPVSRILKFALRHLRELCPGLRLVVSYADADQGHHGGIYQATNWIYTGKVLEGIRDGFMVHGRKLHPKTVHSRGGEQTLAWVQKHLDPGATEHRGVGKHKYLMPLDEELRRRLAALSQPYPKRAGSADSGTPGNQSGGGGANPTPALQSDCGADPAPAATPPVVALCPGPWSFPWVDPKYSSGLFCLRKALQDRRMHLDAHLAPALHRLDDLALVEVLTGPRRRPQTGVHEEAQDYQSQSLATMSAMSEPQLAHALGLTDRQALVLAAVFELHRRLLRPAVDRPKLAMPEDVSALMLEQAGLDHERFWCLPMDARSRLIGRPIQISQGDVDSSDAGPRLFLRAALRAGAVTAIAVHNHPSGDPGPSAADLGVTRHLVAAGRAADLQVVDHIIIVRGGGYVSLRRSRPELFA